MIGRDVDALDPDRIVNWLERDQQLDCRAVRIGDDAARAVAANRVRVDLRHHQRDVVLIAKLRGVVDHGAAGGRGPRRIFGRDLAARRKQADVRAREIELGQILHRQLLAGEAHGFAERAIARQRVQLGHGKFALLEHADHGVTHQSGRPDHRHPEAACHRSS